MENADGFVDMADILNELEGCKDAPKKGQTTPLKEAPRTPAKTSQMNGAAGESRPQFELRPELVVKLQMEYPEKFVKERLGGYEFKAKSTLLRALLHRVYNQSKRPNNKTLCDPLDYVGDYVLKFIISQYLLEHCAVKSKEHLAQRRALVECQEVYALLAVRNGFHKAVFSDDCRDWERLDEYMHNVKDVQTLKELGGVEKRRCFIQNFFQSVAGAVYVDSGYDLRAVERVYLPMLKPFLDEVVDMDLSD